MKNDTRYLSMLKDKAGIFLAFILTLVFTVISIVLYYRGGNILWLIPPALIAAAVAFISIDRFLLFTVLLVPVSVQLIFVVPESSTDIFLPTEFMLAGILILMLYKLFVTREISSGILRHPVSVISFCLLGWSLITSFYSAMPVVSLKSFATKMWFFAGFYLLAVQIFNRKEKIRTYFGLYMSGMVPVIIFYLIRMWQAGIFNQKFAYKAIRPFFNDHTALGASLAFCIPVIVYFIYSRNKTGFRKFLLIIILLLFSICFIFCYSRAAWISLVVAAGVALILLLKISWKIILPVFLAASVFLFFSLSDIMIQLKQNKQDSSDNIQRHIQSISNIRSDASNVERLNRWNCAIRMFREKPFLGWGPATYQFNYAPFQIASEKTVISTNYGDWGNAHSEYLGSLVDSGFPGLVFYLLLVTVSLIKGIMIWKIHPDKELRYLTLAMVTGLITYIVHGLLNNFLDTDKISALFWGMIAAIVAIDIEMKQEIREEGSPEVGSDN